jgi:hypothetical protein
MHESPEFVMHESPEFRPDVVTYATHIKANAVLAIQAIALKQSDLEEPYANGNTSLLRPNVVSFSSVLQCHDCHS